MVLEAISGAIYVRDCHQRWMRDRIGSEVLRLYIDGEIAQASEVTNQLRYSLIYIMCS